MLCAICSGPALTISGGSLTVGGSTIVEGGTLTVTNGGTLTTTNFGVAGSAVITGAGSSVTVTGQTIIGNFAPASLTISDGGVLNSQGGADIATGLPFLGTPTATVTGPGSTWNVGGPFLSVGDVLVGPGALIIANGGGVNSTGFTVIGDVTGASTVTVTGAGSVLTAFGSLAIGATSCGCNLVGTLTVADGGVVNSPGLTSIGAGSTLNLGAGGLAGAIVTPTIANDGQIIANFTDTLTLAAAISGAGTLSKTGPGTLILAGTNTYTGATTIDGGTLIVNGSIANSTVTVNAGGRLGGTGTLGNTIISGGTLSPGNSIGTLTVSGNLTMTAAASYLVEISPTNADRTNVAGTATLAGTVQAAFAAGSFMTRNYTILSAAGGRSGTFSALTTANLPAGFSASLSYTATDVILNLTAALGTLTTLGVPNAASGPGAPACAFSINQCNVANAIDAFFNNGGTLPGAFANIFGLTGVNLGNALTLLSGEAATGAQQGAFQLTNQFLGIMLDPFVDGRNSIAGAGGPTLGFAPEREELPEDIALAYAKLLKAPPKPASFDERWTVWGAGYGGGNRTSGDPAVVGSHDLSARTAGGALARQRNRRRARRRRHQLEPGAGLGRRQQRCVPGRRLRRDAMGPGLSRRGLVLHQPLDVDRPLRLCRRPSQRELQRAVVRRARRGRLSLRHHLRRAHALCRSAGAELPHARLQRGRPQRRRLRARLQRAHRNRYPQRIGRALRPPAAAQPRGRAHATRAGGVGARLD